MDCLWVGQTVRLTCGVIDRLGWVGGRMDRLVARQTDKEKDRWVVQQTYRRSGWGEGARWGCKATYSLLMVGGPLDWGRRGLGSVESHRCNWAARKSHLGVSRRSYRPGYTPWVARKHLAHARRVLM